MGRINHVNVISRAWEEFDDRFEIKAIIDVSAHVSTNQVYKVSFYEREPVFAKISDYGQFDHFREDHIIINNLANNLEEPYSNFLARALTKRNELFVYRYFSDDTSAWTVFYNPIRIKNSLPRRLDLHHIRKMGRELARFHKACSNVSAQLPIASKNVITDIHRLTKMMDNPTFFANPDEQDIIRRHCERFLIEADRYNYSKDIETIPVFVDWNIGNFSVNGKGDMYSRWDYDWFRESTRVMDFYFFSRVTSDIGDRTVFSYVIDTLMEERFLEFLKAYHKIYPLTENEIRLMKETYRFFILNYVIKDGNYFFLPSYARKLKKEAYELYLPAIDHSFNVEKILKALKV